MKAIKWIILCLVVLYSFRATAQQPLDELQKVLSFYKGDFTVSYKLKLTYTNETLIKPDSLDFSVVVHGNDCYYKMQSMEMFSQDGTMLTVDHDDKVIVLDKAISMPGKPDMLSQFDSLTKSGRFYCSLEKVNDKYNKLILKSKSNSAYETEIIYQKENHFPLEVISPYVEEIDIENGKVWTGTIHVRYSEYKVAKSPFPRDKYSIYKYIQKDGKKFSPTSAYKNYQVFNYITP